MSRTRVVGWEGEGEGEGGVHGRGSVVAGGSRGVPSLQRQASRLGSRALAACRVPRTPSPRANPPDAHADTSAAAAAALATVAEVVEAAAELMFAVTKVPANTSSGAEGGAGGGRGYAGGGDGGGGGDRRRPSLRVLHPTSRGNRLPTSGGGERGC